MKYHFHVTIEPNTLIHSKKLRDIVQAILTDHLPNEDVVVAEAV